MNCMIQGFLFRDFEDSHQCSRREFSPFYWQNLTSNHFVDKEMSLEVISRKDGCV